jgi:putative ABC transport system substrate-binding protein
MPNKFPNRISSSFPGDLKSKIKNRKWLGLVGIVVTFVLGDVVAEAQQAAKKIPRLAILTSGGPTRDADRYEGVRRALRERGYVEGQNIAIETPAVEGEGRDRQVALVAVLGRLNIDIIVVAGGDDLIRDAMDATKTIPIVLWGQGSDPVKAGFVKSLAHPGGNVTGITNLSIDLGGKRLELLKEAVPKLVRVAVLYDPASPGAARQVKEDFPAVARAFNLTVRPWEIRRADDFEKAFAGLTKERTDGLYVGLAGGLMRSNAKRIADFALKSRLPSMGARVYVDAGGLMSYGADSSDSYRRVAYYVDRILKGAKPADLPVEQPMKFEFVINLKAAKAIGLTIPQWTLMKADRVIK